MSHTTTIKTVKVTNVNAMERAVAQLNQKHGLNLKFQRGGSVQLWYEAKPCAFTVTIPGVRKGLNVGFQGTEAEGYTPLFDAHGGWIAEHIGGGKKLAKTDDERNLANIGMLMHAYAVEQVREVAGQANCMVGEEFNPATGEMVMQLA